MHLTDRSRYIEGLQKCLVSRFYKYHSITGYGFVKKGKSLPLATGTYIHEGMADVLEIVKRKGEIPSREEVREVFKAQVATYKELIRSRGFLAIEDQSEVVHTMEEQSCLIEGILWAWYRVSLPEMIKEFEVVLVEQEIEIKLAGDILQMLRPDIVLRSKISGRISAWDHKTAAYIADSYVEEFRESIQMALGCLAAERFLAEPVEDYYIHAIVKGVRKPDYDSVSREYNGPRRQQSLICYGYCREANPPLNKEDWQPKWKYLGEDGKNHTLGRDYQKMPIWRREGGVEEWIFQLPIHLLQELFIIIGPYKKQKRLTELYLKEMQAHEKEWVEKLWKLYSYLESHPEENEFSSGFEDLLSNLLPRSWNCHHYGMPCEFTELCFGREKDPLGSGKFVLRTPHHAAEKIQMDERGIVVPEEIEEEIYEDQ